ncbi:MAG: arylesterase [Alphaproteobacteria bacterium]|nr:arylesterase [Alphaproteobacteria bacterium]MBV9372500.1 arylesterase [Alphaproteobacteria bacterium]MBV9902271.1 arylesterase [Alphaproteobacteria bacterium]
MPASAPVILAFGDSLVAGYGLPREDGFAPQMEAALRARGLDATVINAGVSGNTSGGASVRLKWVLDRLPSPPDLAIVALGGNDILRAIPARETREDMATILTRLEERGVPVVLAGMVAPPFLGDGYRKAFNALFPDLAREHRVAGFYPFFLTGVAGNPKLNLPDGLHPNRAGVARMVAGVLPIVTRALGA